MPRSRVVIDVTESDSAWTLCASTEYGLFVHEVDKSMSFVDMFDETHVSIASFLGVPVDSLDARFSLQHVACLDSNSSTDESSGLRGGRVPPILR